MSWHRIFEQNNKEGVYYEYDDQHMIGAGGMGVVYFGRRVDNLGNETPVAIKKINAGIDPHGREMQRARREASIRIRHENLLYMYGMVTMAQKDFMGNTIEDHYVIMEYLNGISLSDFIDGHLALKDKTVPETIQRMYASYKSDPVGTSKSIIRAVLSGITTLHDSGYIHRDIDPSNVIITSDGGIKVIDYGLCKNSNNARDKFDLEMAQNMKQLSVTGQILGKPSYAPEELLSGKLDTQGMYTDTYSIGMMLYHLVTGKVPFDNIDVHRIIEDQKKSSLPLGEIEDKHIAKVIKKATSKKIRDRYPNCSEFRVAIDSESDPLEWRTIIPSVSAVVAVAVLIVAAVANWDKIKEIFMPPTPRQLPLSELCDSLLSPIRKGMPIKDSTYFNMVKDSVNANEKSAAYVWKIVNDYSDTTLYIKEPHICCFVKEPHVRDLTYYEYYEYDNKRKELNIFLKRHGEDKDLDDRPYKDLYALIPLQENMHLPHSDFLDEIRVALFLENFKSLVNKDNRYFNNDNVIDVCLTCLTSARRITWTNDKKDAIMQDVDYLLRRLEVQKELRVDYIKESSQYNAMLNHK